MKKIAFIVLTLITLLITLRIDYNFSKNSNNIISMYEEKGNQIKSIKKIPENVNLNLITECKGEASLEWNNTKRQIKFSSNSANIKCNLTFKNNVILNLSETTGTVIKTKQKEVSITGENYGKLSCSTNDSSIASCVVEGTKLKITGLGLGNAVITVREDIENKTVNYNITVKDLNFIIKYSAGTSANEFNDIVMESDGYVVVGYSFDEFDGKAVIAKYNFYGELVWEKFHTEGYLEYFYAITTVSDGYVVVGESLSDSYISTPYIIKYDLNGNFVWQKKNTNTTYTFNDIITISDGFLVAGESAGFFDWSYGGGSSIPGKGVIIKYNSNGVSQWEKIYDYADPDFSHKKLKAVTEFNNEYYFAGRLYINPSGTQSGALIVKYNKNGTKLWEFGFNNRDWLNSIIKTSDGVIVVGSGSGGALIAKFNSSGSLIWGTVVEGTDPGFSQFYGVTEVSDGYIAVGKSEANDYDYLGLNRGSIDGVIAKFNKSGTLLWVKTFGGSNSDCFNAIVSNGTRYGVVGYTYSNDQDFSGTTTKGGTIYNFEK